MDNIHLFISMDCYGFRARVELKFLNQSTTLSNNTSHGGFVQGKAMLSMSFEAQDISNNLRKVGRKDEFDQVWVRGSNNYLIVNFCIPDKQDTNFLLQVLAPVYNFQYFSQEDEKRKKKIKPKIHESSNPIWLRSPGESMQTNTEVLLASRMNQLIYHYTLLASGSPKIFFSRMNHST